MIHKALRVLLAGAPLALLYAAMVIGTGGSGAPMLMPITFIWIVSGVLVTAWLDRRNAR